jgi:hypothetical protein
MAGLPSSCSLLAPVPSLKSNVLMSAQTIHDAIEGLGPELIEMVHLAGGSWCSGHGNTSSRRSWAA